MNIKSIKKSSISTLIVCLAISSPVAFADDDTSDTAKIDYTNEQTLGRQAASSADRVSEAQALADIWSAYTEESVENLFRAFYDANNDQLASIKQAQDYEAVRDVLNGEQRSLGLQSKPGLQAKLGNIEEDLVYIPVVPCRLVNTRVMGGPYKDAIRGFNVHGSGAIMDTQGGNSAGCTSPRGNLDPSAVHVVISAHPVAPENNSGRGNMQAAPHATAIPQAVLLKYNLGTNITSGVIVKTARNIGDDIDIRVNGQLTDIVIDVMGFYYPVDKDDADRLVFAHGNVNLVGTKISGSESFVSGEWVEAEKRYEITLSENYLYSNFTTVVTPSSSACKTVTSSVNSISGKMLVYFTSSTGITEGDDFACSFNFITFKDE